MKYSPEMTLSTYLRELSVEMMVEILLKEKNISVFRIKPMLVEGIVQIEDKLPTHDVNYIYQIIMLPFKIAAQYCINTHYRLLVFHSPLFLLYCPLFVSTDSLSLPVLYGKGLLLLEYGMYSLNSPTYYFYFFFPLKFYGIYSYSQWSSMYKELYFT